MLTLLVAVSYYVLMVTGAFLALRAVWHFLLRVLNPGSERWF